MFEIKNMSNGWLTFSIKDSDCSFGASYLTNVVEDISDGLMTLKAMANDFEFDPSVRIRLSGEHNGFMYLRMWLGINEEVIVAWEQYTDVIKLRIFEGKKIDDFLSDWNKIVSDIFEEYKENFAYIYYDYDDDDDDYNDEKFAYIYYDDSEDDVEI